MSSLLLLLCLLAGALAQAFNYVSRPQGPSSPCVTPQGQQGQCLLLKECPSLFSLFRQSRTLETRRYLEQLTCNRESRYPRICCAGNQESGRVNGRPTPKPTPTPTARPTPRQTPRFRPTADTQVSRQSMVDGTSGEGNLLQHRNVGLLPQDDCGLEFVPKIYGGNETTLGEFPWAVMLQYEKNGQRSFECGGALISDRYVLTAAHCSNKGTIGMSRLVGVRLGEYDTSKNPDCVEDGVCRATGQTCPDICAPEPVDVGIEEEIVHAEYRGSSRNQFNDIALLRLSRSVPFSDFIRPICVPIGANLLRKTYEGSSLTATGWGRETSGTKSVVKLKANLPTVGAAECVPLYAKSRLNVTSLQLCAGGVPGVDVCQGDSGGPLMSPEAVNGGIRYVVTGIVSYGSRMCHFGIPGVYTKVSAYAGWILDQLRP